MTMERAAEIISKMPNDTEDARNRQYDLFAHFYTFFGIKPDDAERGVWFAQLCGFATGHDVVQP